MTRATTRSTRIATRSFRSAEVRSARYVPSYWRAATGRSFPGDERGHAALESRSDPASLDSPKDAVQHERSSREPKPPASSSFQDGGPTPFLSQPRAHAALSRQLAAIEARLLPEIERRRAGDPDSMFEIHVIPHRLFARLGDAGVSFSWIAAGGGQGATVADGRLLVIQWAGVPTTSRGIGALKSARLVRERVYHPEGVDAEHWCWRVEQGDAAEDNTYTTDNLVAYWLARSSTPLDT